MPTTEIAGFQLLRNINVDNPDPDLGAKIQEWSDSVVTQEGHQESWIGIVDEKSDELVAMITWDSVEAHIATLKRPDYKAVAESISTIFSGPGYMHHTDFEPYDQLAKAVSCPITEIATFYFDDEPPDGYLKRFRKFCEAAMKEEGPRPLAAAAGITHEEVEHEDVKGNAVVFVAGWNSIEAHGRFRESEVFRKHMPGLMDGAEKSQTVHISFRKVQELGHGD
ncbi:hypothetical protein DOTSEDRAFT_72969 [Dothistroma septosporum NZE10]|uniref:ABM domain-containing protein n=1 Tax=Dothistroma septosporum (strain NZE10 / CBS 128990) TaxID=675120 RepID=N1PI28_DOTSN|nr:hypothetical protein DOTSEDRAFT_72969 [Dothistroma septosporum NZE10]